MANIDLCKDVGVLYFPNIKYFNKNSYLNYEGALTRKALEWYMETSSKINMADATPAIGYDTVKQKYMVIKAKRNHIDVINNLGDNLELSIPLGIFCALSFLGCLLFFCLYLVESVEDAERAALLPRKDSIPPDIFLNNSQETVPHNFGMRTSVANRFKHKVEKMHAKDIELMADRYDDY